LPVETKIDTEKGLRMHALAGRVTLAMIEDALAEIYARPDYRSEAGVLWDVRAADLSQIKGGEVRGIVEYVMTHRGAPPGTRTAILVARDLDFGLARMAEQQLEAKSPSDVTVFRDMDEAMAWLEAAREEEASE